MATTTTAAVQKTENRDIRGQVAGTTIWRAPGQQRGGRLETPCTEATTAILGSGFIPHFWGKAMTNSSQTGRGIVKLFGPLLVAVLMLCASGQSVAAAPQITPVLPPGGIATIAKNTSILLRIFYGSGTFPVSDGTQIDWSEQSGPSASFTPSSAQSSTVHGYADITLNVTTEGTYIIRAGYCPDGCFDSYDFTINVVTSVQPALAIGGGDGQSTPPNTPFPIPLTVIAGSSPIVVPGAISGGNPQAKFAPGVTISWAVISGSATLLTPTSVTNSNGVAKNRAFAGPTPGPVVIRATRNDPVPSLAPASVDFHLTVTDLPQGRLGELPGLNANQQAIADALDELCSGSPTSGGTGLLATSTSPQADLQARCQELIDAITTDPDGVIAALDELFADIALVQSESSLLAAESQFENIKVRIAALRSGTNRTAFGGLALNTSGGRLPIGTMLQSLLDGDTPEGAPTEAGAGFSRWGFFAAGNIGR
ncbi:MAG: hypothetical protein ABIW30_00315, partial [Arenimonas sp.]